MTALCAPVSPRVERKSPASGKHKPCKGKEPFGAVFARPCGYRQAVRKQAGESEGLPCFPSQDTADGNADRIRLCRAFGGDNKNCDLGVARIKTSQV